jgi:excisionase family DNA binding protein
MDNLTFEQLPIAVNQLYDKLEMIEALIRNSTPQPNANTDQPLTVKQAAEFLSLAKSTIYRMAENRELPHYKHERRLYFVKKELIDWLEAGRRLTLTNQAYNAHLLLLDSKRGGRHGEQ